VCTARGNAFAKLAAVPFHRNNNNKSYNEALVESLNRELTKAVGINAIMRK